MKLVTPLALAICGIVPIAWAAETTLGVVDASVGQGNDDTTPLNFTVHRGGDLSYRVKVSYATAPVTAVHAAVAGTDYVATSGSLQFDAGVADLTVPVSALRAPAGQPDRRLMLSLSNARPDPFRQPLSIDIQRHPWAQAIGDLNGDGRPDLAVVKDSFSLEILLNTGTANELAFGDRSEVELNYWPIDVAATDVNADGKIDLVALGDSSVAVLLNTTIGPSGAVTFAVPQNLTVPAGTNAMAVADLNRDGLPDIALTHALDDHPYATVLLNTMLQGSALVAFTTPQNFDTGRYATGLAAVDLNGDGKLDLVSTYADYVGEPATSRDPFVSVLVNTTPDLSSFPSFAPQKAFDVDGEPQGLAVGDLNGDGRADLAVYNNSLLMISVLLNNTNGGSLGFALRHLAGVQTFSGACVAIADFDSDGKPDIALTESLLSSQETRLRVLTNRTAPASTELRYDAGEPMPLAVFIHDLDAADLNSDSKPDLIASAALADSLFVTLNAFPGVSLSQGMGTVLATIAPFAFDPVLGVAPDSDVISGPIAASGIRYAAPIAVDGGEYSIDGASFTSSPGTVQAGDLVRLRVHSAPEYSAKRSVAVQIGGVPGTFSATTRSAPEGPASDPVELPKLGPEAAPIGSTRPGGGPMSPWTLALLAALGRVRRRR